MTLCDRLEAEQVDAGAAHARLVATLLGTLTQSVDAAELAANWQRLAEHFDTLFTTEASLDALKQTILQLAVMGKLVPQDPNDEPASELLKRIAKERARLESLGSCKKSKAPPFVGEAKYPFALPEGWSCVHFDEIVNPEKPISYGVLVPGPDVAEGVPFVRIGDLSITNPPVLPEKAIDSRVDVQFARTRLDGGEILMGVVGSIGKLGVAPMSWRGANIARAICRIVPTPHFDKSFLLLLLQSKVMQVAFTGDTRTLAQPTLNVGLIRNAYTPIPPLAEQHRIVAKVDELMALCDRLKAGLAESRTQQEHLATTLIESALQAA
ncbi:MAG: restriction endonuclease subunit S [Accumulibacter sp.]|jgi:type I restriction enzyme S subunit